MGAELVPFAFVLGAVPGLVLANILGLAGIGGFVPIAAVGIACALAWLYSPLPNRVGMGMGDTGAGYWGFERPE